MAGTVLSLLMLAAIALLAGAVVLWRRTGERRKPLLMVLLAAVMLANIAIWTVPAPGGGTLLDAQPR
jgi:ABC-type Co2+ transport system permease subunit